MGDLDQDQPRERLEQPELPQHPDRRHDRERDDEPAEDQQLDDAARAASPPLQHVGDHRRQHDHDRDAGDGEDGAVDERCDQHVVACLDRLAPFGFQSTVIALILGGSVALAATRSVIAPATAVGVVVVGAIPYFWNGTTLGWAVLLLLVSIADRVLDAADKRLVRSFSGPPSSSVGDRCVGSRVPPC